MLKRQKNKQMKEEIIVKGSWDAAAEAVEMATREEEEETLKKIEE